MSDHIMIHYQILYIVNISRIFGNRRLNTFSTILHYLKGTVSIFHTNIYLRKKNWRHLSVSFPNEYLNTIAVFSDYYDT